MSYILNNDINVIGDFMLNVAAGNLSGYSAVNKFGANPDIAAGTTEDIWDGGGTYPFPTTTDITHIRQAVDQLAMRGVTVQVQGLDASWNLTIQDIALDTSNTTTPVALATPLIRVFRMKVQSNTVGTEDIQLRNVGGGTTYAIIQAGNNQTLMAIYTVPDGYTAYMTSMSYSTVNVGIKTPTQTEYRLWAADRMNNYEFQLKYADGIPESGPGVQHSFAPYYKFSERTDIKISAEVAAQDGHVHAGFDLILIQN